HRLDDRHPAEAPARRGGAEAGDGCAQPPGGGARLVLAPHLGFQSQPDRDGAVPLRQMAARGVHRARALRRLLGRASGVRAPDHPRGPGLRGPGARAPRGRDRRVPGAAPPGRALPLGRALPVRVRKRRALQLHRVQPASTAVRGPARTSRARDGDQRRRDHRVRALRRGQAGERAVLLEHAVQRPEREAAAVRPEGRPRAPRGSGVEAERPGLAREGREGPRVHLDHQRRQPTAQGDPQHRSGGLAQDRRALHDPGVRVDGVPRAVRPPPELRRRRARLGRRRHQPGQVPGVALEPGRQVRAEPRGVREPRGRSPDGGDSARVRRRAADRARAKAPPQDRRGSAVHVPLRAAPTVRARSTHRGREPKARRQRGVRADPPDALRPDRLLLRALAQAAERAGVCAVGAAMWSFLLRTLLQRAVLLILISIVAHAVIHLAPGEPTEVDPMNPMMKAEDIAKIRKAFHLDEPLHAQYWHWLRDLASGELRSFKDGQPVLPRIWDRFQNSLPLFVTTTLIVWLLSFPTGITAAVRRGSTYDRSSTFVAYALISIPGFFLSYVVMLLVVRGFE